MPPDPLVGRDAILAALDLTPHAQITGTGGVRSCFAVTDLAAASIAAVADALAALQAARGAPLGSARVDRRLASFWFDRSIAPEGWTLPPIWDALAGDYPTRDGWIRLHTNLPHHRAAALSVLDCTPDRRAVAAAIQRSDPETLEAEIVAAGGVAAVMRGRAAWLAHLQGAAVAAEPLILWGEARDSVPRDWGGSVARPLAGLRVLDLTRVLAGPVCTRMLAGLGAEVLRIDPPGWDEANVVPDITLGKRCARLDLREDAARSVLRDLMAGADVVVHGYRPGALEDLGFGTDARVVLAPGAVDVALDAYGWSGPWAGRRGFDSLVQMSAGIAEAGQRWAGADKPVPLPVQALDHATGYLMAAAVLTDLAGGVAGRGIRGARLSLARTAELLAGMPAQTEEVLAQPGERDYAEAVEETPWGLARRLRPALWIDDSRVGWDRGASELGSADAHWV